MISMTTASNRPLAVDLDGTLIHSDVLLESFLLLIKRNPLYLLLVPLWLLKGKAALKQAIASRVQLNPAALPYNQAARAKGRWPPGVVVHGLRPFVGRCGGAAPGGV
jgi:hypothetical protein